ncbi:FG-GAP-like repeat-containing protein [Streptomyces sp. NRRL F-5126]|uniref:FG-GAP-like repeat-containing protein n=1 Tax=Streptomyces sp. NRRL F-5126 TaxID=1463857 RepID=UPI00131A7D08|nr:FG-GAP-like repeat-containing protein [Streptomyces sp. NRRL F-5126]
MDAATDTVSTLTAEPNGSFLRTISSQPVRLQRSGGWVPLDATLHPAEGGGYATTTTTSQLTLSGGGSGPLAVMQDGSRQLSLTFPSPLPTPTVTGDTALYQDVLPGVDLRVSADEQGGFSEVLIVKSQDSAANPELTHLELTTAAQGVQVAADSGGNLTASDVATGDAVFHAAAPIMWDSSTTATDPTSGASPARTSARTVTNADETAADGTVTTDAVDEPAPGAHQAPVEVSSTDGQLTLTPDAGLLNDSATHYPVYIDPTWVPVSHSSSASTYVQSAYPGTSNYNDKGNSLGVGDQGWTSPTGAERSYYQFSIGSTMGDKHIHSAELDVTQSYSADWSCTKYNVTARNVGPIHTTTTWNAQPGLYSDTDTEPFTGSNNKDCAGGTRGGFNVTSAVANDGDGTVTFRLTGSESNRTAFKRFNKKATLAIRYNTKPNVPSSLKASPAPVSPATQGCDSDTYGWIGKTSSVRVSAHVSDPDGSKQNIHGEFAFWDKGGSGTATAHNLISTGDAAGEGNNVPGSGGTSAITVATSRLSDGHKYGWHVRTNDGIDTSAESAYCYFWYDDTAPNTIHATTSDFPTDGTGTKHEGDPATFALSATDPAPSGAHASGLSHFDYSTASAAALAGDGGTHVSANANGGATVTLTPTAWGSNTLYVSAVDKAGNQSATVSVQFYVPADLTKTVHPGDVDGDGTPDLLAADGTSGNLDLIAPSHEVPNSGGTPAPPLASNAANGPTGSDGSHSWADTLLAHRSSATHSSTGNWVDDLWAYRNGHLSFYANNLNNQGGLAGNSNLYYTRANHSDITSRPPCTAGDCTAYATDWSHVTQMIAPGDVNGDGHPDLITVENKQLWLYLGSAASGQFDAAENLSTLDWSNRTLMAPGDANGDGRPELWTRRNSDGVIFQYALPATTPTLGSPVQVGTPDFSAANRPMITSLGDLDGDGYPDVLSIIKERRLWANMGHALSGTSALGAHNVVSTSPLWQSVTDIG